MIEDYEFVFIASEGVVGRVINPGAYASRVSYTINGVDYDTYLENDELIPMETIEYEWPDEV